MVDVLGTRLGRYEIRERIGRGGTATVYKAWDTNLDRWVAVKIMHDFLADDKDFRARFEREAKLVASLNHPNIVQIYDFNWEERGDETLYYMVMAYIQGSSLRHLMERKSELGERMTLYEIGSILRGVMSALAFAHARGMVHRDVTPGNILITDEGQAVLADFGIARMVHGTRLTQTGNTSGTPMYMSPEQGVGEAGDHRSDVYSLGVILYEMLAGEPPFSGDSAFAIMLKHVNDPVPELQTKAPHVSPELARIVQRALEKEPEDRYQSVDHMLRDLESLIETGKRSTVLPAATQRLPSASAAPRKGLPRWAPIGVSIGALALLGVLAAITLPGRATSLTAEPTLTLAIQPLSTRRFAPSMTMGPLLFTDDFGPNRGQLLWPITTDDPEIYRNIEDGVYRIWHRIPASAVTTIFDEEAHSYASPYQYEADMTISEASQRDSATGIVFRYRNDDAYYVFAVNGQGQISLWRRYSGEWVELRNQLWTQAEGTNPAGQVNRLRVVDLEKRIQCYVNDRLLIDVENQPIWFSGAIGIYLATTQSRVENPYAEVVIDNFTVRGARSPTRTPTKQS